MRAPSPIAPSPIAHNSILRPPHNTFVRAFMALCVTAGVVASSAAQALSMPPPWASTVWLGGPRFEIDAPVDVLREQISFDCTEDGSAVVCEVDARMTLRSRVAEPVSVQVVLTMPSNEARLAGEAVDISAHDAPRERLHAILGANKADANSPLHYARFGARVLTLLLKDDAPRVLSYRGAVRLVRNDRYGWVIPAVKARHLLLSDMQSDASFDVHYAPTPTPNRGPQHELDIQVRHPNGVELRTPQHPIRVPRHGEPPTSSWRAAKAGSGVVQTYATSGGEDVGWSLFKPGRSYHLGGPFIGFGATDGGFRTRAGYELAAPEWLLFQLAAETDFHKYVTIVPAIEAASPFIILLPSFGIGAGVPIRVGPSGTEVGVRIQASVAFGPLGFFTAADIYPGRDSAREDLVEWTFMGQISF